MPGFCCRMDSQVQQSQSLVRVTSEISAREVLVSRTFTFSLDFICNAAQSMASIVKMCLRFLLILNPGNSNVRIYNFMAFRALLSILSHSWISMLNLLTSLTSNDSPRVEHGIAITNTRTCARRFNFISIYGALGISSHQSPR